MRSLISWRGSANLRPRPPIDASNKFRQPTLPYLMVTVFEDKVHLSWTTVVITFNCPFLYGGMCYSNELNAHNFSVVWNMSIFISRRRLDHRLPSGSQSCEVCHFLLQYLN
jgi:hypothetical protein